VSVPCIRQSPQAIHELTVVSSTVQHPVSLTLADVRAGQQFPRSNYTVRPLRTWPSKALPRLQVLHFTSYHAWDALHRALWPLVIQAAEAATGGAAHCAAAVTSEPLSLSSERHAFPHCLMPKCVEC
jgi:hypothetical protein